MYHHIAIAPATSTLPGLYLRPEIFDKQLCLISRNRYVGVFAADLAKSFSSGSGLASRSLVLSFDDGYDDFYNNAFPLLKKYNLPATLYVIINSLDKTGYLTKAQLRELADSGLVEIGSHTFNHLDLRRLKDKDAVFEIKESRRELQKLSGQKVETFAYPYGYYNDRLVAVASSSGYLAAVSVLPGVAQAEDNHWLLPRVRPGELSGAKFLAWLDEQFYGIMVKK
jgi:peptidoglycan/xylan/chitin deacetylase (PgdA/CDA1 family)